MKESVKDRISKSGTFGFSTPKRSTKRDFMDLQSRKQSRGSSRAVFLAEEETKSKDRKEELAKKKFDDAFIDYITEFSLADNAFKQGSSKWYSVTSSNKARLMAIEEKAVALSSSRKKTEREYSKVCGATGEAYRKYTAKTISTMKKSGATLQEIRAKEIEMGVQHQDVYKRNRDNVIALYTKHTKEIEALTEKLKKMKK